jgi:WD40 repeat protein
VPTLLFGKAILWNWRTEERLCTYQAHDAVSVAVKPDGSGMYTGHKDGKVREWTFPGGRGAGAVGSPAGGGGGARKRPNPDELTAADAGAVVVPIEHHAGVPVDCIRILPGVGGGDGNDDGESAASGNHRVATKSMDGAIHVYDAAARRGVGSWRVPGVKAPKPGAEPGALAERLTSFNADPRGEFIAVGNDDGEVMVFDVATGGVVTAVEQERDFKALNAVRAAAVSADCRHVHACFGPGIVWRAEVVPGTEGEEEREGEGGPGTPPGETLVPAV